MDPTLEERASDYVLAWLLLPHQPMHSPEPCYTQWVFHVETRFDITQLTSASAHLQDRNTGILSFWGLSFFDGEHSHFSGVFLCSDMSVYLTLKQEGHLLHYHCWTCLYPWWREPELKEGSLFRDPSAIHGHLSCWVQLLARVIPSATSVIN